MDIALGVSRGILRQGNIYGQMVTRGIFCDKPGALARKHQRMCIRVQRGLLRGACDSAVAQIDQEV